MTYYISSKKNPVRCGGRWVLLQKKPGPVRCPVGPPSKNPGPVRWPVGPPGRPGPVPGPHPVASPVGFINEMHLPSLVVQWPRDDDVDVSSTVVCLLSTHQVIFLHFFFYPMHHGISCVFWILRQQFSFLFQRFSYRIVSKLYKNERLLFRIL